MRTTQQFSITLPQDMAEAVQQRIASGGNTSVSDVVQDALRALLERDAAVDRWLHDEIIPGHQEYLANPAAAVPAELLLERVKAQWQQRKAK